MSLSSLIPPSHMVVSIRDLENKFTSITLNISLMQIFELFRDLSMSLMKSSIAYHEKMECNNTMIIDEEIDDISPALSYEEE